MSLQQFIAALTTGEPVDRNDPNSPPWWETGRIYETDKETYDEKLDMLPPRWMHGSAFAFGEGSGPFHLFWQHSGRFFARELTHAQTEQFCRLARVPLHQ